MPAGLDDPAVGEHDDRVGIAHGREPVGDDDRGAFRHQVLKGAAYQGFIHRVEV